MSNKEGVIELTGLVKEVLPGNMYRVEVDTIAHMLICYLSGRLKQHKIRIIEGDSVKIEVSPYDLSKGRVTYRL
jgi:translation initiation factor IF-1